jgi:RNA polymerase sigma factor (sigma-70 family)
MRAVSPHLVQYLSTLSDRRDDGDLLAGFLTHNSEADFAELVRRHGPMIWGACRRALPDRTDAEDAFQTVFLVLVQRGGGLTERPCLGPWLHRVAVWTARNVRRRNMRRRSRQEVFPELLAAPGAPLDLSLDLDAALLALPEKLRSPIVLCHLLGYSRADAAARLGCAERTLSAWLSRGLARLRERLRGLDPAKALGVAAVAVPVALSESVVRAATSLKGVAAAASVLSPTIAQLVEGVIRMFWVKKATAAAMSLVAVFAVGVGIGLSTRQAPTASGGDGQDAVIKADAKAAAPGDPVDARIKDLEEKITETERSIAAIKGAQVTLNRSSDDKDHVKGSVEQLGVIRRKLLSELEALNEQLKLMQGLKAKQTPAAGQAKVVPDAPAPRAPVVIRDGCVQCHQVPDGRFPPPPAKAPEGIDKQLADLQTQWQRLHVDTETAKAEQRARALAQEQAMKQLQATINALQKEKAAKAAQGAATKFADPNVVPDKQKSGYLEVRMDARVESGGPGTGKPLTFPFAVKEVSANDKVVGEVYFTSAEVFGRYLARTAKDTAGPKEVRIVAHKDMPHEQFHVLLETCKAAGYQGVIVAQTAGAEKPVVREDAKRVADMQLLMDRERAVAEHERAQREAARAAELEAQKAVEQAKQQQRLMETQRLLQEKEREIEKLKDVEKNSKVLDELQRHRDRLRELQEALELKEREIQKLKEKDKKSKPPEKSPPERP